MMLSRRIRCEIAVLAVLSVLAICLFPAAQGPYSVVCGPATAFQAARAAVRLRIVVAQSVLDSPANRLTSSLVVLFWMPLSNPRFQSILLPECNSILRC